MKKMILSILVILGGLKAAAQYVPPIVLSDMAVYCNTNDYVAQLDSFGFTLKPGDSKTLNIDLSKTCTLYSLPDTSILARVYFLDDPAWKKNKDQIAIQGLKFEVIDASTGKNFVDLVKSAGGQACNFGLGFDFSDIRPLSPMALRPLKFRLTNVGRNTVNAAFGATYSNTFSSICGDYPKGN